MNAQTGHWATYKRFTRVSPSAGAKSTRLLLLRLVIVVVVVIAAAAVAVVNVLSRLFNTAVCMSGDAGVYQ